MKNNRPYIITVQLSGATNNLDNPNPDNIYEFCPLGNTRTSEKSAVAAVKRTCALMGCKIEKIISIKKKEA